ncbi:hypothetical protein A0H76_1772 [Hepatospora eriocheir]|uniref:Uncharacterized protein n=1 Tax=Hepatospora eriocheir TaxID=1081669 RepID=A0A1X0QGV3_9MICR|nr:hypothetical protein A0H76_1772 [Hepatospora eriocheir]
MDCFYDLKIKLENMIFLINKKIDSSLTSKDRDDLNDFKTLIEHFYNLCEFISLSESNFDFLKNLTELFNVVHFLSNY